MSALSDRIAQFRKMTTDDPENELGHFRLGQLLMDDGQHAEAVKSFETTLGISPNFSKVYQLLGECYTKLDNPAKAIEVLTTGHGIANTRGDKLPRDAMANLLAKLGAPIPVATSAAPEDDGPDTGFRCARPGCPDGKRAKPLTQKPMDGELGDKLKETICASCWNAWWKDYSIKVVNEMRLDLSSESGQAEYDRHLREFFGME
jgi:tetratricopeptide (TPR) repeat protein